MNALNKRNGVEAKMMVRDVALPQEEGDGSVIKVGNKFPKFLERVFILPHIIFRKGGWKNLRSRLWQVDTADCGIDITRTKEFREADVIHLHWVNQGMLSLMDILHILDSGKPVVWTLHDEWPYLGVCHYRGDCTEEECIHCPIMAGEAPHIIYRSKQLLYFMRTVTFVGCSGWITKQARRGAFPANAVHINNCVPASLFHPRSMQRSRKVLSLPKDKRLLLFCSQNVTDERKGIRYLVEALKILSAPLAMEADNESSPERLDVSDLHLVIVGKGSEEIPLPEGFGVSRLGTVGEQDMPLVYNAVDAFLTPSLQDNLPNTIAEAMSCGTPCVGFNVDGIPEMINHKLNGYVARYRDAADLAEGIRFVLSHDLRNSAFRKASAAYKETTVARQHVELYKGLGVRG